MNLTDFRQFRPTKLSFLAMVLFFQGFGSPSMGDSLPNILWITAEDVGLQLGSLGHPDSATPHLDRLAESSLLFTRAHSTAGVCAPSKASFVTGMYPQSFGAQHMRGLATLSPDIPFLPDILGEAGYFRVNRFNRDYNFPTPSGSWDRMGPEAHWRDRPAGKPFFAWINLTTTHERFVRSGQKEFERITADLPPSARRNPQRVQLPGWLPDTQIIRWEWARYLELVSVMDAQVGSILQELEETGISDNTIVFFFADHGPPFPRAKQFNFDSGLRVPLIVHFPAKWASRLGIASSGRKNDLVSLVDLPPTLLSILGLQKPPAMEGNVFLGPDAGNPRKYVFSSRDRMDERVDMSRTVSDGMFKYHRHFMPHLPHYPPLQYMDKLGTAREMRRLAARELLPPGLDYFMGENKRVEELYDLRIDPNEMVNLAGHPAYDSTLEEMREALFTRMLKYRDTGLIPEYHLRQMAEEVGEYRAVNSNPVALKRSISFLRRTHESGPQFLATVAPALQDDFPLLRYWGCIALAKHPEDVGPFKTQLAFLLHDPYPEVALAAAEALAMAGEIDTAAPLLERMLDHKSELIRLRAANVLDSLPEIPPRLLQVAEIQREKEADAGFSLSVMVRWALDSILPPFEPEPRKRGPDEESEFFQVGVASVNITPEHPVRLHAFPRGERTRPTSEVKQEIHAKALVMTDYRSLEEPVILVTADILGFSENLRERLFRRLSAKMGLKDRSRFTVTATHNHSAPAIASVAPFVFQEEPDPTDAEAIEQYEARLLDLLEDVVLRAWIQRSPGFVEFRRGINAEVAVNRRVVEDGKWTGFGEVKDAPVVHDLPVFSIHHPDGSLRAIWLNYACHGVCWRKPSIHGDWMGVAREDLEGTFPGVTAMVTIGCAGDVNPVNATNDDPWSAGRSVAASVRDALDAESFRLSSLPDGRMDTIQLPLEDPPPLEHWEERTDWYGRHAAASLKRGDPLPKSAPLTVQTWDFGGDLCVVFLSGEVFADYDRMIKEMGDPTRLMVVGYANDDLPGYVPTASDIPEGGFEVDRSRSNYGIPARFSPEVEATLLAGVKRQIPQAYLPVEIDPAEDGAETGDWWQKTGHPRGKWWNTYEGYKGKAAEKIWERVEIPPSPVLTPEQALESFSLDPRFRIEVVAAEPMIINPVFFRFDEQGRLWVVEMPGYMRDIDGKGEYDPTGRVMVLEDTDHDGRMDEAHTFISGLVMPRSLAFTSEGVLVAEPPHLWLLRDNDGDLRADERHLLLDDFGDPTNPEHSENGFLYNMDNWYYLAKSDRRLQFRDGELIQDKTVFRGQWGITQDDFGRLFYNYNAAPLHADLVHAEYLVPADGVDLSRRQNLLSDPLVNVSLTPNIPVYPERVTPLVTLGASDLHDDGTLKQFTSACAPYVYRGGLFPSEFSGNVFVCEPVGNLVKRFLVPGQVFRPPAIPVDDSGEFLASTDERFRPVFLDSGPDGALYVADMHTGIIEHKFYVTPYLRSQVARRPDIGRFTHTGRIFRIVPVETAGHSDNPLNNTHSENLVSALSHPNGWVRDHAQRLLVQENRQEAAALLHAAATDPRSPKGRLHALGALQGLDALTPKVLEAALRDSNDFVVAKALRMVAAMPSHQRRLFRGQVEELLSGDRVHVLVEGVMTLADFEPGFADSLIIELLSRRNDWWLIPAVASACQGRENAFIKEVLATANVEIRRDKWRGLIEQLSANVSRRNQTEEVRALLSNLDSMPGDDWKALAILSGMTAPPPPGEPVPLVDKPENLIEIAESEDPDRRERVIGLLNRLTWPGKENDFGDTRVPLTPVQLAKIQEGRKSYEMFCMSCHGQDGSGMTGLAPTLQGSEWIRGSEEVPARIVLHGLTGPIEVNGQPWNGMMPGLGAALNDDQIAGILSYIRRQWGEGASFVEPERVREIRGSHADRVTPWTAEELLPLLKANDQN